MKLSDYVFAFLAARGLKQVFLLPGGGCMHLTDSVGKREDMGYVCCLHEQGCGFAAEAYAEYGNGLACVLVTAGPGATNAITGAACAWIEGASVVFISGQAKRADLIGSQPLPVRSMGQQELDIVSMVKPVTKYAAIVLEPADIRKHLEEALWRARQGRPGPVWLDIPLDVQAAQIEPDSLASFAVPPAREEDFSGEISKILAAFAGARRPVVYAGNGVRTSGASEAFLDLVELWKVPALLSWKASDLLCEDHPSYAGRPGGIGQRAANFVQQKADFMLVLGARLDLPSVAWDHAGFARNAYRVYVDVDPAELAKFKSAPDQSICADLGTFLPALLKEAGKHPRPDVTAWRAKAREWQTRFPVIQKAYWDQPAGTVNSYVLMDVISDQTTPDDVFVPGSSGPCSDVFYQAFRVKQGQRILNAPGLGAMGTGIPGTIGACLASGGRRVINVNGDGGFQLNIQELETVRRLNLPVKYFVLDNDGYRSIVSMQRNHFQGRLVAGDRSSRLTLPNCRAVGEAYGLTVFEVNSHADLRRVVAQTLAAEGPAICVVKTSMEEVTAPRATADLRPDGRIVSRPMEDMAPLLEREEFAAIMAE